ncbi:MAG: aldose 1-epimerase family protein [Alphaproteobacteria bacterium]|nr:aldose 1-epimerase family protein [Alphaproteobacteria bacterium]
MPRLFGRDLTRRELERHVGARGQAFGVTLVEHADGPERGVRTVEFRTGGGLSFTVNVDRSMDIGRLEHRGVPIAWQSGTGFRSPWLQVPMEDNGSGFMRGFSGFLCTCGLDHMRQPESGPADHFDTPLRARVDYPLHGRGALAPARLAGYGEHWDGDACTLWCEGVVMQVQVLGEHLSLTRRIEARVGESSLVIRDRVVNEGFARTPHMLLYHINLGWPLLDEGARFRAPVRGVNASNAAAGIQAGGYRTQLGPTARFIQQVFDHDVVADRDGRVPAALINDRLGLGLLVDYEAAKFPCLQQWQAYGEGIYAMGIEPCTSHWGTRAHGVERGEIVWLEHGQSRDYDTRIGVVEGAGAIAALEARIDAIHPQLAAEVPPRERQPEGGPVIETQTARR